MKVWFTKFAQKASNATGHPGAFLVALMAVVIWAITGPIFKYSDTWQLVINTGTTIVTFMMVFLIQNTQNRDTAAMQIKLDEIINSMEDAHDSLLDLEELDDVDLNKVRDKYRQRAKRARARGEELPSVNAVVEETKPAEVKHAEKHGSPKLAS